IKELREDYDLAWKNFAILVRYNRQRLYYEQALRDYNIPIAGDVVTDAGEMENGAATSEVTVEDGVHIETVHASKGLQYAVVYYAGLCEKLTPGECTGDRKARKRQLDEERRLYYVGVTRAEACLFLLYCKRRFWKGKLRRFRRSRFLPHERNRSTEWNMPVILFKIYVVVAVLGYMLMYIIALPYLKLRYGKNFDAWLDHKIQDFSRYCMKVIRIDLTIEDQAQLGKVDWSRPVFVVGNHNSFVDIPIVFLAIQKTVGFVAKKSLGRIPFLNFWMHKIGCVLVNREKGGAAKAVRQAVSERGNSARIFIFPEGTRSKTGALGTFKSGVFRFACENDAIMLPLVIKGSGPVWERRKDTKRCKVNVKVLAPIDVLECRKENEKFDPKIHMLPMVHKMMEDAL
ncbi:MAG: 1-acyl-sn-glycerol-3-phosphate acyltransferase, partial [Fibrobacter sp.]|nr:1-acyl-sn-glycerol-3-phosphate acyltransferase [Fibrobacter sp.]